MNIFVAKLNFQTEEDTLLEAFNQFGEVSSAKVIKDKFSGRSKGYGFVEMPNDDEGRAAIQQLNDSELDGRTIVVKESEQRERRSNDFNRGGGGGGYRDNRY